jgi:hypothetical protein
MLPPTDLKDLAEAALNVVLYLLFIFLSNRFLGSFGFFVLETLTPKQINLHLCCC